MITCKLCNKKFSRLAGSHLKWKHGITTKEYLQLFPGESIISSELSNQIAQTVHNLWINPCYHERLSKAHKGQKPSLGYKHNIESDKKRTESRRKKYNGNYFSKEGQAKVQQIWRNIGLNRPITTELKQHLSEGLKRAWQEGKFEHQPEKAALNMQKRLGSGKYIYKQGTYCSTVTGQHEWYHSSWELQRFQELDRLGLKWTKKHGIIIRYKWNDKYHFYTPDILIPDLNQLEEIKPNIFTLEPQNQAKFEAARNYCNKKKD